MFMWNVDIYCDDRNERSCCVWLISIFDIKINIYFYELWYIVILI